MTQHAAADISDWKKRLDENAHNIYETFRTDAGKSTMALLESSFQHGDLFNENSLVMAKNAAQFELVQYIKILVERGSKNANK